MCEILQIAKYCCKVSKTIHFKIIKLTNNILHYSHYNFIFIIIIYYSYDIYMSVKESNA